MVIQYYAMKSKKKIMFIIDLNNIYEFNILKYTLSQKQKMFFTNILYHVYAPQWKK
jgi:hypothetical protein